MAWPATAVVTGDPVTTIQLNGLPVLIANTTLTGDAASIDFTGISAHYAHLMLECYMRSDVAITNSNLGIRFNGDVGLNYDYQWLRGNAATADATETFATDSLAMANFPGDTATANVFGGATIHIPNYANAANNKDAMSKVARKFGTATGGLAVYRIGGFWRSNAAINQVTALIRGGGNFRAGSRISLYGLP